MIAVADRLHSVQEYYFSKKLREVRAMMAEGKPVINMGIGSPDLLPHQEVIDAIGDSMNNPKAHQYQSYQGLPELRKAIADFYRKHFDVIVRPEDEILPLMGSKEGIMHISMAYLNEGDEVLIPNPGYPTYQAVSQLVGARAKHYNLTQENHWLPDLEALAQQDLSKTKLMWVNYPHMPTGAKADKAFFKDLVAFAKAHQILLVNDNPYSFVLNQQPVSLLSIEGAEDVVLELNSLSKTFNMAGWRVGMLLGKAEKIQQVLKVKSNMDSGMFYGIQQGAIVALQSGREWFDELNAIYRRRKSAILRLVELLGCSYEKSAAGMFVWAKLPEGSTSAEEFIEEILQEKHVFITPGTIFGSQGEGYIRFSLCVPEEKIEEAITRF